jgi:hypothetical protein
LAVGTGGPGRLPTASDGLAPQPQPEGAGERGGTAPLRFAGGQCSVLHDVLRGRQRAGSGAPAQAAAAQRLQGLPGALGEREAPLLEALGQSGALPMASVAGTGEAGALAGATGALEAVEGCAAAVLEDAGCSAGLGMGAGGRAEAAVEEALGLARAPRRHARRAPLSWLHTMAV